MSPEKESNGLVTALSVIGLVFGLMGLSGSFIPCLGSLAFFIGIPAAIISGVALGIAQSKKANNTFAIIALTISGLGIAISAWQYFAIVSAGRSAEKELKNINRRGSQSARNTNRETAATPMPSVSETEDPIAAKYIGIWEYDYQDAKHYLRISKDKPGIFKFEEGYKYDGNKITWIPFILKNANSIYLKQSNGKLNGEFISSNYRATHAVDFAYKITLDLKSDNKLLYSVYSEVGNDALEATKISD